MSNDVNSWICSRSFELTPSPLVARYSPARTWSYPARSSSLRLDEGLEPLRGLDPLLDHVEDHVAHRSHAVHAADDLTHGEPGQVAVLRSGDAACGLGEHDALERHRQRVGRVVALPCVGPRGAQ